MAGSAKYEALLAELLEHTDPFYADESPLIPLDQVPPEDLIAMGLLNRQLEGQSHTFWNQVLTPFDAADLAGKARMLGPLWPKYRHRFE